MKFEVKNLEFDTPRIRQAWARRLSAMIESSEPGFVAYMPNQQDDTFWALDSGNNWKLKFLPELNRFEVWSRYGTGDHVFAQWIAYRLEVTLLDIRGIWEDPSLGTCYHMGDGRKFAIRITDAADGSQIPCFAKVA